MSVGIMAFVFPKRGSNRRRHRLSSGGSQSGKTTGSVKDAVRKIEEGTCAVALYDPKGSYADKLIAHIVKRDLHTKRRIIYDDLNYLGRVVDYTLIQRSTDTDPLIRRQQNEIFKNDFLQVLGAVHGDDLTTMPTKGTGAEMAYELWAVNDLPQVAIARCLDVMSAEHRAWRRNLTKPGVIHYFEELIAATPRQRHDETFPTVKMLEIFASIIIEARTLGTPVSLEPLLREKAVWIMRGSPASRASDFLMASHALSILQTVERFYKRTGNPLPVRIINDECLAHPGLMGKAIMDRMVECLEQGVEIESLWQCLPFNPDYRSILLQNCDEQVYYKQGDYQAAELAARQILRPDPRQVKHQDVRRRTRQEGFTFREHEGKTFQTPLQYDETDVSVIYAPVNEQYAEFINALRDAPPGYCCWTDGRRHSAKPQRVIKLDDSWMKNPQFQLRLLEALNAIRAQPEYHTPTLTSSWTPPDNDRNNGHGNGQRQARGAATSLARNGTTKPSPSSPSTPARPNNSSGPGSTRTSRSRGNGSGS